ncbi:MAG TPA: carbon-nitrogen hydrolase family protein [Planctomycetota bacterium]
MRIRALQMAHVWGDVPGALARLEERLKDVDLAVLPEAAFTGYVSPEGDFDLRRFAEPLDGPTMQAVAALAARHGTAIAAPLIERDGQAFYNACVLFDAAGRRAGHWRKRHPWIPETWATPGNLGTPVVEWRGLRVAAAICYDLHFIETLEPCDLFLFPSAWVQESPDTRVSQLRALARRFHVTVVNANWARSDPALPGQGGSVILGPDGRVLARAKGVSACDVSVTLDPPRGN